MHYLQGDAEHTVPVWRMIATPSEELEMRARRLAAHYDPSRVDVAQTEATIGGGSLPGETLPSWALALRSDASNADALATALRRWSTPIVGRIVDDRLLLDLRTVPAERDDELIAAMSAILADSSSLKFGHPTSARS
jgi:L-seryl-tRNA(Ser) seleniumtransferase